MSTLQHAQAKLAEYEAAESLILQGQEVRLGGGGATVDRWVKFADLAEVRKGVQHWRAEVSRLSAQAQRRPTIGGMAFSAARFD